MRGTSPEMILGLASCVWMMSLTRSIGAVHVLAMAPEMPPARKSVTKEPPMASALCPAFFASRRRLSNRGCGEESTYDRVTRQTAFNAIDATANRLRLPFAPRTPFAFVSCAESGWPDVSGGSFVEDKVAPEWLRRYLVAKRAVEAKLTENSDKLRPVVYRPSLIWSWGKLDVLPIIPVFNLASALGVPFVDRTIRVGTLADAIVAGVAGDAEGVQRFAAMDELALEARA